MASTEVKQGGISTFGLLGVVFIVLKLTHVIGWSWWLVLAPFWGGFALFIGVFVIMLLILGLGAVCGAALKLTTSKLSSSKKRPSSW